MLFERTPDRIVLGTVSSTGFELSRCDVRQRSTGCAVEVLTTYQIIRSEHDLVKLGGRAGSAALGTHGPEAAADPLDAGRPATAGPVLRAGGGGARTKGTDTKRELDKPRYVMLALGLERGAAAVGDLISKAVTDEFAPHRFLDERLGIEHRHREEPRAKTSLRLSGLTIGQTLANFNWSYQPDIDRRRVESMRSADKRSIARDELRHPARARLIHT